MCTLVPGALIRPKRSSRLHLGQANVLWENRFLFRDFWGSCRPALPSPPVCPAFPFILRQLNSVLPRIEDARRCRKGDKHQQMEQPGPRRSAFGFCLPFYNKDTAFGLAFSHGSLEILVVWEMELMTQVRAGEVFP